MGHRNMVPGPMLMYGGVLLYHTTSPVRAYDGVRLYGTGSDVCE